MMPTKPKGWGALRGFFLLAGLLVLLLAWRMLSPRIMPRIIQWIGDDFMRLWSQPYFSVGDVPITPAFLIKSFIFLVLIIFSVRFSRQLVRSQLRAHSSMDVGQQFALERGTGYLVFIIGLIIGLQSMGVNLSSLIVLGGAIGIGIGLGLQTVANNFLAGIILLIERSIKVGDRVEVGKLNGDVVHIGMRATWVRTNDNIVVVVPNSHFTEKPVTNWTAEDRQIRFSVPLGVSYGSDPEKVREILLSVAAGHPDVLPNPKPDVIFREFGDSSLDFELRVWTIRHVQTPQILKSELYFRIFRAFRENGIEIPFPQRDVHLKSANTPIPTAGQSGAQIRPD
jgi:small-conductance mechanosensitive channel